MPITPKPKRALATNEAAVQELISKGGSVAAAAAGQETEHLVSVLLRIPAPMLARIDASVKRRLPVRISRQAWIIEALPLLSAPRGSARLIKVKARKPGLACRISATSSATFSSVHTSNDRGTNGTSRTWATDKAARRLVVSLPPVSMMMS
jgi:hypothetical protein